MPITQNWCAVMDSAALIRTENGQIIGVVMVFCDVSREKQHSKQLEFLRYHDSVTGRYSRHYIEEAWGCLDSAEHLPIPVVIGDVNGLKLTNGHKVGDSLP